MPIVNFAHHRGESQQSVYVGLNADKTECVYEKRDWEEGSYCPLDGYYNTPSERERVGAIILWETNAGMCISERERNMHDDSDFFMTVWSESLNKPVEIMYASTRGWSYPAMNSFVDATPEVLQKYNEYCKMRDAIAEKNRRNSKATKIRETRKVQKELANRYGFSVLELRKYAKTERPDRFESVMKLLAQKKLRNQFRISLQTRLVDWLKANDGKFNSPFSTKQWDYV